MWTHDNRKLNEKSTFMRKNRITLLESKVLIERGVEKNYSLEIKDNGTRGQRWSGIHGIWPPQWTEGGIWSSLSQSVYCYTLGQRKVMLNDTVWKQAIKGTGTPLCSNLVMWSNKRPALRCKFLNTTVDLRLEIQPALKLNSASLTLGAIAKSLSFIWYVTTKNHRSFQTILTRRQNCLLGGMLVVLSQKLMGIENA